MLDPIMFLYIDQVDWGAEHLTIIVGTEGRAFVKENSCWAW